MKRTAQLLGLVAAMLVSFPARADGPKDAQAASLLKQGQEALEHNHVADACKKLGLSLEREDHLSTLALLAYCHELDGHPGKAWNEFRRAKPRAPSGDKATFIEQHLKSLESKVARAKIDAGGRTIDQVRVDNEVVLFEGGKIVVDPGVHVVRVDSGGKALSRNVTFALGTNPDIVFEEDDGAAATIPWGPTEPRPSEKDGKPGSDEQESKQVLGWALVGTGAVVFGFGAYEGFRTFSIRADADHICGSHAPTSCDSVDAKKRADARLSDATLPSWLATGGIVLGGAAIAGGIIVLLNASSSPKPKAGRVTVTPAVSPASVGVVGTF